MKSFAAVAAFAAGASALAIRGDSCCFTVTASGGTSGTVGQLDDGQNRVGGGLPPATYCITSSGTITDGSGRGCILTREYLLLPWAFMLMYIYVNVYWLDIIDEAPTTQFQCDTGATPTPGFSVSSSGDLTYNGSSDFVACQTGDNGEYNIYTSPPSGDVSGCVDVTLEADKCAAASSSVAPTSTSVPVSTPSPSVVVVTVTESVCAAPTSTSPAVSATPTESTPVESATSTASASPTESATSTHSATPTSTGTACSTSLTSGSYEYPHLIVPIDSSSPDTAAGTSYNGEVSSTISSIFNFDIPASDSGKTCTLVFLFPEQKDLETSSFTFSGDGKVDFAELSSTASESTTYNNAPSVKQDFGDFTLAPGNSYVISSFACPAGQAVAYEVKEAGSTNFTYFQDYNPSPWVSHCIFFLSFALSLALTTSHRIGLYITTC